MEENVLVNKKITSNEFRFNDPDFDEELKPVADLANKGLFSDFHEKAKIFEEKIREEKNPFNALKLAEIYIRVGYITDAEQLCLFALDHASDPDLSCLVVKEFCLSYLCNIAATIGDHDTAYQIMLKLAETFPESESTILNLLFSMSYNPKLKISDYKKFAEEWYARNMPPQDEICRPQCTPLNGRKLRVGYISGDFKVHPVGLFLRDIFAHHNSDRVEIFVYNTDVKNENPVIKLVDTFCTLQNVHDLSEEELDALIRKDKIDVLVDLSGFTAETRIRVFLREPAPVMVSWLGYWATTGIQSIDAVLLDKWHAPEGTEKEFSEKKIVRLPVARFCYQPLGNDPQIDPVSPCLKNGYVTFGCFNNTKKFNSPLFDCWAEILKKVPDSRLLLKWNSFHDPAFCARIRRAFASRGIEEDRLSFSGWSVLGEMLQEYNKVDIALDPFPFTGGMTTCNALWMGVPVVTLIGDSVVSRQGYAILGQLDLEELCANTVEHYINIATGLATNTQLLQLLRLTLRPRMCSSALLDVRGFANILEDTFYELYDEKLREE